MKNKEKILAQNFRRKGFAIGEIAERLGVSKSSVSLWVRNTLLSDQQHNKLISRSHSQEVVEKRRIARLKNESQKRQIIIDAASKEIKEIKPKELWLIGIMLYWAEGGKTQRGLVRFSNADAEMIKVMMIFLEMFAWCQMKNSVATSTFINI